MNLYRGFTNDQNIDGIIPVRKDRQPRHLNILIHELSDEIFLELFEIKFRSQALFCTGDIEEAFQYGNVKCIEPIECDDFAVCWSPKIKDFIEIEDYLDLNNITKEAIYNFIIENKYQTGKLEDAIKSKNEIMIYCDEYRVVES